MKKASRFIALAAALAICTTAAVSCGGKDKTKKPQTADAVMNNSYRSEDIDFPSEIQGINGMMYLKDADKVFISAYGEDYNSVFYTADSKFTDFTKVDIDLAPDKNADYNIYSTADDNGSMYFIVQKTTHGDIPKPDWDDPNFDSENFDYEAYENAAVTTSNIVCTDESGKIISDNPVEGVDDQTYVNFIQNLDKDRIILGLSGEEQTCIVIGTDGKKIGDIDVGDFMINYASKDTSGRIACDGYGDKGIEIRYIDVDKMKLSDEKIELDSIAGGYVMQSPMKGAGDYTLYLPMNLGLYGLKEDGSTEEIINWIDSDIESNYIQSIIGLDSGDFFIVSNNYDNTTGNRLSLSLLTKRDTSEMADTLIVTMGMIGSDSDITSRVTQFNKSNDKYRIKIKDYSEFDVYDEKAEKYTSRAVDQLKNDIISGNAPDMICVYDESLISTLSGKGVFADLYTMMENDSDIKKDMFMPNILEALETDGKLYSISPSFSIQTYAGKTKYLDGKENWTMDEFVETCQNLPDGMKVFKGGNTKSDVYSWLDSVTSTFVDYPNKKCSFDSSEYIKLLEFCNTFPDTDPNVPDSETSSDDEMQAYYNDMETQCLNDKALLDNIYFSSLRDYSVAKNGTFGDDITLVGLPSNDGQGARISLNNSFAILNNSGCKEAAWEFIKVFLGEEYQNNLYNFPVIEKYFDIKADECMEDPYYINEDGEKEYYDNTWFIGDREIDIPPITQQERDFLVDFVKNTTKLYGGYNADIYEICQEEVQAYFKGEKSSEDAAKMIQNRVSILVSEQN